MHFAGRLRWPIWVSVAPPSLLGLASASLTLASALVASAAESSATGSSSALTAALRSATLRAPLRSAATVAVCRHFLVLQLLKLGLCCRLRWRGLSVADRCYRPWAL